MLAAGAIGEWLARLGFPLPEGGHRIGHLDGLRGYLALLVAASHFILWMRLLGNGIPWGEGPACLATLGQGPVAIFFMITGLLFYPKAREGIRGTSWSSLFVSRLFRIYPAALASICMVCALLWIKSGYTTDPGVLRQTLINALWWLLFVGQPPLFGIADSQLVNAGVFWTLGAEWIFYLAVLPLLAGARSLCSSWLPKAATPLLMMPLILPFKLVIPGFAGFLVHFTLGMLICEMRFMNRLAALFSRNEVAILSLALMLFAAFVLPTPTTPRTALFYAPFLASVVCGNSYGGLFSHRASLVLGEVSYGIYVLHGIVLWAVMQGAADWVRDAGPNAYALMPPAFAAIVLLAACVFVFIEAPMTAIGRNLARRIAQIGSAPPKAASAR